MAESAKRNRTGFFEIRETLVFRALAAALGAEGAEGPISPPGGTRPVGPTRGKVRQGRLGAARWRGT